MGNIRTRKNLTILREIHNHSERSIQIENNGARLSTWYNDIIYIIICVFHICLSEYYIFSPIVTLPFQSESHIIHFPTITQWDCREENAVLVIRGIILNNLSESSCVLRWVTSCSSFVSFSSSPMGWIINIIPQDWSHKWGNLNQSLV